MALARKCDRCGKLYEHYDTPVKEAAGIAAINGFAFMKRLAGGNEYLIEDHPRDLCPDCVESFLAWLWEKDNARGSD